MLGAKLSFRWPQCARTDLRKIIHSSNNDGIDLIDATLNWDPKRRPTAAQVRTKFFFSNIDFLLVFKTFVLQSGSRFHRWNKFP